MTGAIEAVAAVLHERGSEFRLENVTVGPIRADEVLVRIVAAGICHTDLSVRNRKAPGSPPAILGHEGAGLVEAVGEAVVAVRPNDAVVLTYLCCGECVECRAGSRASCSQLRKLCFALERPDGSHALQGRNGAVLGDRFFGQSSFATYAVANERNVVPVPPDLPLALLAPLGCGVMTGAGAIWNELDVKPGTSVAIFGAGAVGLSAVIAAKVRGAKSITAIDRVPGRLALARELGATHTILADEPGDLVTELENLPGDGLDYALDTTGVRTVIESAFAALRQRGSLGLVACADLEQSLSIPHFALMSGCKRVIGIIEGGASAQIMIPKMIDHYRAGEFPFDRLVRLYRFDQINQAVDDCETGQTIKPVLTIA